MLGLLDLVEDGDREVLPADEAVALAVLDQAIKAEAELGRPLAGLDRGGGRDRRPIEVAHLADRLQCHRGRLRGRRLHALFRHVVEMGAAVLAGQAAGANHEKAAFHARLPDHVDHAADVVLVPLHRDNDRVMALQRARQHGPVAGAAGPHGDAGARLELAGVTGDCRDLVAAPQRLVEDTAADVARGANDRDVHVLVLIMRSRMAATVSDGASCGTLWPMRASMRRS